VNGITPEQVAATIKRFGLIKGDPTVLAEFKEGPGRLGGFSREQWLKPGMLAVLLSQSRAAHVMTLQLILPADPDDGLVGGILQAIQGLTFVIGDNYEIPHDILPPVPNN
jgi:hypothetical protein